MQLSLEKVLMLMQSAFDAADWVKEGDLSFEKGFLFSGAKGQSFKLLLLITITSVNSVRWCRSLNTL